MEFIKKYYLLIVPMAAGVVFLGVSWAIVAASMSGLEQKMKTSAGKLGEISAANTKLEAIVFESKDGKTTVLAFPNMANFKAWDNRYTNIKKEIRGLHDKVQQINWERRKTTTPPQGTLPKMVTGGFGRYKDWYRKQLKDLVLSLDPTQHPTFAEYKQTFDNLKAKQQKNPDWEIGLMRTVTTAPPPSGVAGMPPSLGPGELRTGFDDVMTIGQSSAMNEEVRKLTQQAKDECDLTRAKMGRIYADLGNLSISEIYGQDETANEIQLWYAQLGLWVQSDVVEAIRRLNDTAARDLEQRGGGKLSVLNSPVKHLIGIRVSNYVLGPNGAIQNRAVPEGMLAQRAGMPAIESLGPANSRARRNQVPFIKIQSGEAANTTGGSATGADDIFMTTSLNLTNVHTHTERYTSDLYGVVYVTCQVVVDSRKVVDLMDELCKLNLYTILCLRTDPVPEELRKAGFMYGEAPVTLLTFQAELLMFHEYYKPYMPKDIQDKLLLNLGASGTNANDASGVPALNVQP